MDRSALTIDGKTHQQMLSVASRVPASGGLKKASSMDSNLAALAEQTAAGGEKDSHTWGRWTAAEHEAFLTGLKIHGREWKKVAACIPTRTAAQIRSHAQKYFARVSKEKQQLEMSALKLQSLAADDDMPPSVVETYAVGVERSPQHSLIVQSILENPSNAELRCSKTLASLRSRYETLEAELMQEKAPALPDSSSTDCPATLALEMEQKSLREAAEARYELKRLSPPTQTKQQVNVPEESNALRRVSLASMPSRSSGVFDSSQVLALSQVSRNLVKEKQGNRSISTIKDDQRSASLQLIREQLMNHDRPTKIQKTGHASV